MKEDGMLSIRIRFAPSPPSSYCILLCSVMSEIGMMTIKDSIKLYDYYTSVP